MTKEDFKGPKVLVDFWAEWCGPCKMMKPRIEKFAEENPDVKVIFCNVDEEHEMAQHYSIRSIPTLVYFEDDEVIGKKIGSVSDIQIKELVGV